MNFQPQFYSQLLFFQDFLFIVQDFWPFLLLRPGSILFLASFIDLIHQAKQLRLLFQGFLFSLLSIFLFPDYTDQEFALFPFMISLSRALSLCLINFFGHLTLALPALFVYSTSSGIRLSFTSYHHLISFLFLLLIWDQVKTFFLSDSPHLDFILTEFCLAMLLQDWL